MQTKRLANWLLLLSILSLMLSAACQTAPTSTQTPPPKTPSPTTTPTATATATPDLYVLDEDALNALAPYFITLTENPADASLPEEKSIGRIEGIVDLKYDVNPKWYATTMEDKMREEIFGKLVRISVDKRPFYLPAEIFKQIHSTDDLELPGLDVHKIFPSNPGEILEYLAGGFGAELKEEVTGVLGGHVENPVATKVDFLPGKVFLDRVDPDGVQDGDPSDDLVLMFTTYLEPERVKEIGVKVIAGEANPTYYYALVHPSDVAGKLADPRTGQPIFQTPESMQALPDATDQFHHALGQWLLWSHVVLNNTEQQVIDTPYTSPYIDIARVFPAYYTSEHGGAPLAFLRLKDKDWYKFVEGLAVSQIVLIHVTGDGQYVVVTNFIGGKTKNSVILDSFKDSFNLESSIGSTTKTLKDHNMTLDQVFGSYAWVAEHVDKFNRYKGPIVIHETFFPEVFFQMVTFPATKELLGFDRNAIYLPDVPEKGVHKNGIVRVNSIHYTEIGYLIIDGLVDDDTKDHLKKNIIILPISNLRQAGIVFSQSPQEMSEPGIFIGDAESLGQHIGNAPEGSLFFLLESEAEKAKPFIQELLDSGTYDLAFYALMELPAPYRDTTTTWKDFLPELYEWFQTRAFVDKLGKYELGSIQMVSMPTLPGPFEYPLSSTPNKINYFEAERSDSKKWAVDFNGGYLSSEYGEFLSGFITILGQGGPTIWFGPHIYSETSEAMKAGWDPLMFPFIEYIDNIVYLQVGQAVQHMDIPQPSR